MFGGRWSFFEGNEKRDKNSSHCLHVESVVVCSCRSWSQIFVKATGILNLISCVCETTGSLNSWDTYLRISLDEVCMQLPSERTLPSSGNAILIVSCHLKLPIVTSNLLTTLFYPQSCTRDKSCPNTTDSWTRMVATLGFKVVSLSSTTLNKLQLRMPTATVMAMETRRLPSLLRHQHHQLQHQTTRLPKKLNNASFASITSSGKDSLSFCLTS